MTTYTKARLAEDLAMGILMALGFTAIAAIPLGIVGLSNFGKTLRGAALEMPWATYGELWLVIPGSYVVAGLLAAGAVFALRPLRRWLIGWITTGFVVAVII